VLQKIVAFAGNYPPKIDCVDESWDRTTGISWGERYGVSKADVVKKEKQRGCIFEKCIEAAVGDDRSEWRCDLGYNFYSQLLCNMSRWFIRGHPCHRGRRARCWNSRAYPISISI
jgi:hypothetical protein